MTSVALVAILLMGAAGDETDAGEPQPTIEVETAVESALVEAEQEVWAGESRRVHVGVGLRVHWGAMSAHGFPLWVAQSEVVGVLSLQLRKHDELRLQLGLGGGFPDTFGGESSVTFLHGFSPRLSFGAGGFVFWGIWALRAGVEAPLVVRIGSSRRQQLVVAARLHVGVLNGVPFTAWTASNQQFAIGGEVCVGYVFQF